MTVEQQNALSQLITTRMIDPLVFEGQPHRYRLPRVFGGQVVGMAVDAATKTVPQGWTAHSLQSQFIRPGIPDMPIRLSVQQTRDGGSFATRHVSASQGESTLLTCCVSFHKAENGRFDHQLRAPAAPAPDSLPDAADLVRQHPDEWPDFYLEWDELDIRVAPVDDGGQDSSTTGRTAHSQVWIRATSPIADVQNEHNALLACVSDLTFLSTSLTPHGVPPKHSGIQMASLDHCLWFHRPFRLDEWLLYDQVSPSAAVGRGFCRGEFFTESGVHVATVVQEGLIRSV